MDKVKARNESQAAVRQPIRNAVENLILERCKQGKFNAKYISPYVFGVVEGKPSCCELDWLIDELRKGDYRVRLDIERGYLYTSYVVLISWV